MIKKISIITEDDTEYIFPKREYKKDCIKNGVFVLYAIDADNIGSISGYCPECLAARLVAFMEQYPEYQIAFARACLSRAEQLRGKLAGIIMGGGEDDSGEHNLS